MFCSEGARVCTGTLRTPAPAVVVDNDDDDKDDDDDDCGEEADMLLGADAERGAICILRSGDVCVVRSGAGGGGSAADGGGGSRVFPRSALRCCGVLSTPAPLGVLSVRPAETALRLMSVGVCKDVGDECVLASVEGRVDVFHRGRGLDWFFNCTLLVGLLVLLGEDIEEDWFPKLYTLRAYGGDGDCVETDGI